MGVGVVLCSHVDQPGWEGGSRQGGEGKGEEDKKARAELQKAADPSCIIWLCVFWTFLQQGEDQRLQNPMQYSTKLKKNAN